MIDLETVKFIWRQKLGDLQESSLGSCHCGAVVISAALDDLEILQGEEVLTLCQFGTMTATLHFCTKCGIDTHHQRRSNPSEFGINVACLEGAARSVSLSCLSRTVSITQMTQWAYPGWRVC